MALSAYQGPAPRYKSEDKFFLPSSVGSDVPDNMVLVEGGSFEMGSDNGESDEKLVHEVTLSSFYMGKYEVTVSEFKKVIDATGYKTQDERDGLGYIYYGSSFDLIEGLTWRDDVYGKLQTNPDYPIIRVSLYDAKEYCKWLSKKTGKNFRLPTEEEWEYAARGGKYSKGYRFAGFNEIDKVAWHAGNSNNNFHPVGQKNPNELGLYDMSGNVWEWCNDWYDSDYYSSSPRSNPTGASISSERVNISTPSS